MQLTMTQTFEETRIARDDAIENALGGADSRWIGQALTAVEEVARQMPHFTTDDVAPLIDMTAREPRALGPIMQQAKKAGYCVATRETRPSNSKVCHGRDKRVWKSLLFGVRA